MKQPMPQEDDTSNKSDTLWLSLLHLWLTNYFKECIAQDDLALVINSLSHLYNRTDMLYNSSLPALSSSISEVGAQILIPTDNALHAYPRQLCNEAIASSATHSAELQGVRFAQSVGKEVFIAPSIAPFSYNMWTSLRAVKRHVERIELLCHLLSGTTASILDALGHHHVQETAQAEHSFIASQETWDIALAALISSIEQWQHAYLEQPSFATLFTEYFASPSALAQFDNACALVLHCSSAIFRDILPDIQAIGSGDDEALATIFLDMTQHTDQILLHIESLLEPLQMLIKQFALPSEIV